MSVSAECETQCLPPNYNYLFDEEEESDLNTNEITTFRVKEITDENSAKLWIQEFSDLNKVTWRILRTFPNSGKVNVYKICLRCQHFTDKRAQMIRTSKNTNCPAEMVITVKRIVNKSKSKFVQNVDYPTIITLKHEHNHDLNSAAVLKYRDMSEETENKFLSLFQKGHSPSSALQAHKIDLMVEYGDKYSEIAADGKFLPSISIVHKLFAKKFAREYRAIDGEQTSNDNFIAENNEEILIENPSENTDIIFDNNCIVENDEIYIEIENPPENMDVQEEKLSEEEHEQLDNIFDRIKNGLENNPVNFVPAVRKMLENSNLYSTESGLISALYAFGVQPKKQVRRSHITKIGVQPTSVSRKEYCLTGKRKLSEVRPTSRNKENKTLEEHSYTTLPT